MASTVVLHCRSTPSRQAISVFLPSGRLATVALLPGFTQRQTAFFSVFYSMLRSTQQHQSAYQFPWVLQLFIPITQSWFCFPVYSSWVLCSIDCEKVKLRKITIEPGQVSLQRIVNIT